MRKWENYSNVRCNSSYISFWNLMGASSVASLSEKNVKCEGARGRSPAHPAMGCNSGSDAKNNLVALLLLSTVPWRLLGLGKSPQERQKEVTLMHTKVKSKNKPYELPVTHQPQQSPQKTPNSVTGSSLTMMEPFQKVAWGHQRIALKSMNKSLQESHRTSRKSHWKKLFILI